MDGCILASHQNSCGETRQGFPPAREGFETCVRWKAVSEECVASKLTQLFVQFVIDVQLSSKNT